MRILHSTNYYPPYVGGIGEVCYYIANSLVGQVEQLVVCTNDVGNRVEENVHGVEVHRAKSLCQIRRQQISTDLYGLLKCAFNEFQPDIIHLHMPNPLACLYILRLLPPHVKVIVHWHSDIIGQPVIYPLFKKYEKKILERADRIVVTSPTYAEGSLPLQPFKSKITLLQNIISKEKINITPEVLRDAEEIKHKYCDKPILFTIGRHVPYKGLTYLIEAERMINSDCVILIGGNGIITDQLKEQAKGRDRIKFIGYLDDAEMLRHMCAASIFAFPSITKNEAFGIALAEAMYCGAVPVTFTIEGSGVNWVSLNGVTGLEVANSDAKEYACAVDKLLNDKNLLEEFSKNAKKRVEDNFTLDAIKPLISDLYQSVLNNK